MLAFRHTALMLALLVLSACAYTPGGSGFPWAVCKEDSSQYLQGVDWDQARKLNIRIRQGDFSPTYLGLYMGQPYVLSIENADDGNHSFRAMEFFRAVAVAGVSADGGDFQHVECLEGVTIPPRTKTTLRFVAVRDGTYEFDDNSLMISLAMIGSGGGFITIEPPRTFIESPLKHLNLFDHKPIDVTPNPSNPDGAAGPAPGLGLFDDQETPDAPPSGLFDDQENTTPDQPSSLFDDPAPEQPIDPAPSQPVESVGVPPGSDTPPSEGLFDGSPETPVADQGPVVPSEAPSEGLFDAPPETPVADQAPVVPSEAPSEGLFDAPPETPVADQVPVVPSEAPSEGLFEAPPEIPVADQAPDIPSESPTEGQFDVPPETPVADQAPALPAVPGDDSEEVLFVEEVPAADQAPVVPAVPGDDSEEELFVEEVPVAVEAPETPAIVSDLTQPIAPEAMPEGFQFLEGPAADVYSDPPDNVRTRPGSGGDGGEDRLDSSG